MTETEKKNGPFFRDALLGVLWPFLGLLLDPTFFKSANSCGGPSLGPYAAYFVYPAVGLGLVFLIGWMLAGGRWPQWGSFVAGVFWLGAGLAGLLGIPLFIFCFLAWIPGYVYLRNGIAAWKLAAPTASLPLRVLYAFLGALFVVVFSYLMAQLFLVWFQPVILPPCPDV